MQGLYLLDNCDICTGQKTALVTAQPRPLTGEHLLIVKTEDGYSVTGSIAVREPQTVTLDEFDARESEHGIKQAQRLKWWPEATELYVHSLTYLAFSKPVPVEIAPACGMRVELAGLGMKEITVEDGWYIYEVE